MVIDITNIKRPKQTKDLDIIKANLLMGAFEFGFKERIQFPLFSPYTFYESNYDDIKLEYLVLLNDGADEDKLLVYNPEYRTLVRETCYNSFENLVNYDFIYLQNTLCFDTPERQNIIEDEVFGLCSVNSSDESDSWIQIQDAASRCLKNCITKGYTISTNEINNTINYYLNGEKVGFGKNESDKGFMSIHFSIVDIYNVLNY